MRDDLAQVGGVAPGAACRPWRWRGRRSGRMKSQARVEHRDGALEELALLGGRPRRGRAAASRAEAGGPDRDPPRGVGADVALRVVLLVDLHHAGDGVELGAVLGAGACPRGVLPCQYGRIRSRKVVTSSGRTLNLSCGRVGQPLDLLVDPGDAGLREHDAGADARGAVADDELLAGRCAIVDPAHRLGEREGALHRDRVRLVRLVDVGDDAAPARSTGSAARTSIRSLRARMRGVGPSSAMQLAGRQGQGTIRAARLGAVIVRLLTAHTSPCPGPKEPNGVASG